MLLFLAIDGNTVGLTGLSGALVVALGYMLRDRRDTDKRVDRANKAIIETVREQRDSAVADKEGMGRLLDSERRQHQLDNTAKDQRAEELLDELNEERERNRILQLRLGLKGDQP